jgi:4-alpha-glucanotransferase
LSTTKRIIDARRIDLVTAPFETVRDVLLEVLFAAKSDLLLLPIQDIFGWKDRINAPATIDSGNWSFRLPWPVDRMDEIPEAHERQRTLREWTLRYQRNG